MSRPRDRFLRRAFRKRARGLVECLVDRKEVLGAVNRFRGRFVDVHYSFDVPASGNGAAPLESVELGLAGC